MFHAYQDRYLLIVLVVIVILEAGVVSLHHRFLSTSIPSLWHLGFGVLNEYTFVVIGLPKQDPAGLISNVLVANLPQLVLAIFYILINSMLSTFLVQLEFSKMHKVRKPLRVSEPIGIQRSSYFISMPLRYGIPLYLFSGMTHWLISQSLFLARITALFPDGSVDERGSFSTCGTSPIAIIISQ